MVKPTIGELTMCFGGGSKPPSPPKPPPLPPPVTQPKSPPKPTPPPEPVQQVGNEVAAVEYGGKKRRGNTNLTIGRSTQTPSATVNTGASSNATGINV